MYVRRGRELSGSRRIGEWEGASIYNQISEAWYTVLAPEQQLSGTIFPENKPVLEASTSAVSVSGVNVYQVTAEIGPSGNGVYAITFKETPTGSLAQAWGVATTA